jgi:hypothetical protein
LFVNWNQKSGNPSKKCGLTCKLVSSGIYSFSIQYPLLIVGKKTPKPMFLFQVFLKHQLQLRWVFFSKQVCRMTPYSHKETFFLMPLLGEKKPVTELW